MTEEIKLETKECKCICQSQAFKNIVTIATGSFIGVFCALSLFAALHKPPMPVPCPFKGMPMEPVILQPHHYERYAGHFHPQKDFHQKFKHHKHIEKTPLKTQPNIQK